MHDMYNFLSLSLWIHINIYIYRQNKKYMRMEPGIGNMYIYIYTCTAIVTTISYEIKTSVDNRNAEMHHSSKERMMYLLC
jgi:hypothetical protein